MLREKVLVADRQETLATRNENSTENGEADLDELPLVGHEANRRRVMILAAQQSAAESWFYGLLCVGAVVGAVWWSVVQTKKKDEHLGAGAGEQVWRKSGFNYLGGHPSHTKPEKNVILAFTRQKVAVERAYAVLFSVPLSRVTALDVETEEEVRHRLTATRLLLVGVFAFAWKKRTPGSVMVTVETTDGPILFEVPKKTKPQVLALLSDQRAKLGCSSSSTSSSNVGADSPQTSPPAGDSRSGTVKSRLAELDELRTEGLISDEEYEAKRAAILDDL